MNTKRSVVECNEFGAIVRESPMVLSAWINGACRPWRIIHCGDEKSGLIEARSVQQMMEARRQRDLELANG